MCFVCNMTAMSCQYLDVHHERLHALLRCEVVKHAVSHGARLTVKKYGVSELTVCGFVKLLKRQPVHNLDVDFIAFTQIKRDQSNFLHEESDEKVINIIKSM